MKDICFIPLKVEKTGKKVILKQNSEHFYSNNTINKNINKNNRNNFTEISRCDYFYDINPAIFYSYNHGNRIVHFFQSIGGNS